MTIIVNNFYLLVIVFTCAFISCCFSSGVSESPASNSFGLNTRPDNKSCLLHPLAENNILQLQRVFSNLSFTNLVGMVQAPKDSSSWFLIEQGGEVFKVFNGQSGFVKSIFLDLSFKFSNAIPLFENGLISIAFHPEFENNRRVFVFYRTRNNNEDCTLEGWPPSCPSSIVLSEFSVKPDFSEVDPLSEKIILSSVVPSPVHLGGTILFDNQGFLWLGIGDNGQLGNAQNTASIFGKIIRIDVDGLVPYEIPPDNPFANGGGSPEVFAWGLRNPWKMSFDKVTGALWAGDVGGSTIEEINIIQIGKNYGWPLYEGAACFSGQCAGIESIVLPKFAYTHDEGCMVTGGYVYRGNEITALQGKYLFGDFCSNAIFIADPVTGKQESVGTKDFSGTGLVSFSEDNSGELYALKYDGEVFKIISYTSSNDQNSFPEKLSQTGCFDTLHKKARSGLIPYDVNMPLWSDGAKKERWMALPNSEKIELLESGKWKFPIGTILMKNFSLNDKILETRLLMQPEEGQWVGYTYEWNEEQTEAFLVPASGKIAFVEGQNWSFPSRSQCLRCHNAASGYVLGLETPQINRLFRYAETGNNANQMETLAHIGIFLNAADSNSFDELPAFFKWDSRLPSSEELNSAARAYLHVNCAICHQPEGPGFGPEDFRYSVAFDNMGACNVKSTLDSLGVSDSELISPGSPEHSIAWLRMSSVGSYRMPPIGSFKVDEVGSELIAEWIRSIQSCE